MAATAKTFAHGVHPPEHKDATRERAVRRLALPPELVVPLSQHIGAPAKAIVETNQEVRRGEAIAAPGGFVSVPMHTPVAGTVKKVGLALVASGGMTPAVVLRTDPDADQGAVVGEAREVDALRPSEIVRAVQETGMVGLGGAAFPTHVKMAVPEGKRVEIVVANGCECEPYLTTDHRLMLERKEDLFRGIAIALRATGAERAIIGIEQNKPDAIAALREAIPRDLPATVQAVKTKYPQGAEKMLIKALVGREVPPGGLPIAVEAACFNVATLAEVGDLLPKGQGLIERIVTVTGAGVERPGNYVIAVGTPVQFVLDEVGLRDTAREVILGGPMMGLAVASLAAPVTKGVSGILVLTEAEVASRSTPSVYPCIKCGECVEACPLFLNPSLLGALARKREYQRMEDEHHLNDCFECGCCAYVCPSNIPLVQYFRVAKAMNRERKAWEK